MAPFTLTIFLSAFLLFQVQPLIAKAILPWFGGGPGVWTACMLFFQVFLLLGYTYAHLLSSRLRARGQAGAHVAMLLLSLAFVSILPGPEWEPSGSAAPTPQILSLLAAHIGIPFAVLASTSPLIARWFSLSWPSRSPYRLYALSNAGSLLALLSYPFIVEPSLPLGDQARIWSVGYVLFALFGFACAARTYRASSPEFSHDAKTVVDAADASLAPSVILLWVTLAATGSVLLISTTHEISQDQAIVPMLWILPLAIYLVSFIITFDHDHWYRRDVFMPLFGVTATLAIWIVHRDDTDWFKIPIYSTALFASTMVCHGELARARPAAARLTHFFLAVASGGALGGVIAGVVAPRIFLRYWEYPLALIATGLLAMYCVRKTPSEISSVGGTLRRVGWASAILLLCGSAAWWTKQEASVLMAASETSRTFFGITRVTPGPPIRSIFHGRIEHGSQFTDNARRRDPTTYFGWDSGAGIALQRIRALTGTTEGGLRIGVLGLGAGTWSAHGLPGDLIRFYEIDPEVERIAREQFTYIDDSAATVEVVIGDARLMLERDLEAGEPPFDMLVFDAFSSDAIPVHLLTREAYQLYRALLRPEGLLVFNVTNIYLNLSPLIRGMAQEAGQQTVRIITSQDTWLDTRDVWYVIATSNQDFLRDRAVRVAATDWSDSDPAPFVWTDDFASLWSVVTTRNAVDRWETAPNRGHFVLDRAALLSLEDATRIKFLCRNLYDETDKAGALALITTEALDSGPLSPEQFEEYTAQLFRELELARPEIRAGLLVFIAVQNRRASVHVGADFPAEMRARIQQSFLETAIAGLRSGEPSEGLRRFAEASDAIIRERLANL